MAKPRDVQSYLDIPSGIQRLTFIEELERQTLRQVVQALQELSLYFKRMFDTTPKPYGVDQTTHLARLTEHLVRRAVDRAAIAPIDDFYEGDFDSRRVRWCPTSAGTIAQDFLIDAKAESEQSRLRPSASQFSMPATILVTDKAGVTRLVRQRRVVKPHTYLRPRVHIGVGGKPERTDAVAAITTVIFVALYYKPKTQQLQKIIAVASPHQALKGRYNPSTSVNHIWGAGPQPTDPRGVRINKKRLRENPYSSWRVQELSYPSPSEMTYSTPVWVDGPPRTATPFTFVPA